jgi:8-oxo-dGTP pyrophosphatase MutT (NUDIX family)
MNEFAEHYRNILRSRTRKTIADDARISSAVLLLLYERGGRPCILLTKRTNNVTKHKGQISLPGGSRESKDTSLIATALRETFEEVGIPCGDVEILGLLDDSITVSSNFVITPVVGFLPYAPDIVINPGEVEEAIEIPLSFFKKVVQSQPPFRDNGSHKSNPEFVYGDYFIWGATAKILEQFFLLNEK